jgi:hypothetical protein
MTKFSQKNLTLLHSKEISQISLRIICLHKLKNKLIQTESLSSTRHDLHQFIQKQEKLI